MAAGPNEARQRRDYLAAWEAIGTLLRDGRSWSGRERNCCFLNTGHGRFADASAVSGFDHDSDSRAIGMTDWDQDGDLDLWVSNRTAPRLRFLRNDAPARSWLAVRLVGTRCNRDAIGARLELQTTAQGDQHKSIRTLRAGEGYLAQSSKWVHFGLGDSQQVERLAVIWPDGTKEEFVNLAPNERYVLTQGSPLQVQPHRPTVTLADGALPISPPTDRQRIVAHRPLPVPRLELIDVDQQSINLADSEQSTLVVPWASWCQPCLSEIVELTTSQTALDRAGVKLAFANLDDLDQPVTSRWETCSRLWKDLGLPAQGGLATAELADALDVLQRVLVSRQRPLRLPSSFLLDSSGKLLVVYVGKVSAEEVLSDVQTLSNPEADHRDLAIPYKGRWFTQQFPPALLAVPEKLVELQRTDEAVEYLQRHVNVSPRPEGITLERLADLYIRIGRQYADRKLWQQAEAMFQRTLQLDGNSWDACSGMAVIAQQQQDFATALTWHRRALAIRPGYPVALNNVAWILATAPVDAIRNPTEAIELAKRLNQSTSYRWPTALDSLAAAYASAGQFEQAVETIRKAIDLAQKEGNSALSARFQQRLALYESSQAYLEHGPSQ